MAAQNSKRIVLLGKTGAGKSSLANTLCGREVFKPGLTFNSETKKCQAETISVNGEKITLIDTPGLFDTDKSEDELKPEILRCITECAPGPHAFLIVLKWERFTKQENEVITKIRQHFSDEAFKYATVVFTHGDQLPEGNTTIKDFVHQNKLLSDLVEKCGGRCNVFDSKYWNEKPKDEYRSNKFQVEEILKTIDEILRANNGGCYTNEMLQRVQRKIQQEEERLRQSSSNLSDDEIRGQAKETVYNDLWLKFSGIAGGLLFLVFLGAKIVLR